MSLKRRTHFALVMDDYLKIGLKVDTNFDAIRREISYNGKTGVLYFLTTLASGIDIMGIVESVILSYKRKDVSKQIYPGAVSESEDYKDVLKQCMSGVAVLILDNMDRAILIETRAYPTRSIQEPGSEKTIRGAKDGFTESINDNIGLLRRRVRDKDFTIKLHSIGKKSKTDVALIYLDGVADSKLVSIVEEKLKSVSVDSLVMSDMALSEMIFGKNFTPFPLIRYTERPDVATIEMNRGRIIIMVDTSASIILAPSTLFSHVHHVEEYREAPLSGSFLRLVRCLAIVLSVFLLPLWYCLITETQIDNYFVLMPSKETAIPIIVQILLAEFFMEMVRIAIVHTPNELTSAISMVSAIILGSVSIELEIFLPEILVYVSFEAIASFATPSYELSQANRLLKYYLLLLSFALGRVGFLLGFLSTFIYLTNLKVLGVPYLYPLLPFNLKNASTLFYRPKAHNRETL